jgi:hypothetical protein
VIVAALTGLGAFYAVASGMATDPQIPWWLSATFSLALLPAIRVIVLGTIGDAARYLNPDPSNVQVLIDIRQAGVKLLETLHHRGYDRIVVVGHSLGSVIGYDILAHTWPKYHANQPIGPRPAHSALDALESLAMTETPVGIEEFQAARRAYFNSIWQTRAISKRVSSDRVTLVLLDVDFSKAEEQLVVVREESAYRLHLQARRVRSARGAVFPGSADNGTFSAAKEHQLTLLGNHK